MSKAVLLIEDNQIVRASTRRLLLRAEWEVFEADTGKGALAILERHRVDIIIQDLYLPDIGWKALLGRLRLKAPRVPIVLVTGALDHAAAPGFEAVFCKPFETELFLAKLRQLTSNGKE